MHGSRLFLLVHALGIRQPQVQSDIVYISTKQLAAMTGRTERTMRRAVADAVSLGDLSPILVTRPNPCYGDHCHYEKRGCPGFHGGKTLDEAGQPVGAANGYSLNPAWLERVRRLRTAPPRPVGKPTRATLVEEQEAARRALERRQVSQPPASPPRSAPPAGGPLAGILGGIMRELPERGRAP